MTGASEPRLALGWLVAMFEDCGLEPADATRAAEQARLRLARRGAPGGVVRGARLRHSLVRDPMVSFRRIVGLDIAELPFFDATSGRLSLIHVTSLLRDAGLAPDVALAYAKVVVEAVEPAQLFQPVWRALDMAGPVDLAALMALDWSPLAEGLDLPESPSGDETQVEVRTKRRPQSVARPRARPRSTARPGPKGRKS